MDRKAGSVFVLVTPAHNEGRYIGATIRSILAQEAKPVRWVIVNDGSTDETRRIAESVARRHRFIRVLNLPTNTGRSTGSKVRAIRAGLVELEGLRYDFIGNLDADVTMESCYFRELLSRMAQDEHLGICGGKIWEMHNGRFRLMKTARDSVAGAVQLFRRECFEQIGGYAEIRDGFEDAAAEIAARMMGWTTRSFEELPVRHHRRVGLAGRTIWEAKLTAGMNEYRVGYSYLFHLARVLLKIAERPPVIGSALMAIGYLTAFCRATEKIVGVDLVRFLRREQHAKLGRLIALRRMVP